MSFEDYIRYIRNITLEQFYNLSWEEKYRIEIEYEIAYGF